MHKQTEFYSNMYRIRSFETKLLQLFSEGKLYGTTHTYIGQEANGVGVISQLNHDDFIVSNHRCHGHYLQFKKNPYALLREMMGKEDGVCAGRGGSQHLCDGTFFTNGVQGGIMPLALGLAFAQKQQKSTRITTVFIGDGTLGQGVVYETLNIAAKWQLPLLIVVENNRYAQSTAHHKTLAGTIADRFKAFDIPVWEDSSFNVTKIANQAEKMINNVRKKAQPQAMILNTYRFMPHSKSDDGRDPHEVNKWREKDCLNIFKVEHPEIDYSQLEAAVDDELNNIFEQALSN